MGRVYISEDKIEGEKRKEWQKTRVKDKHEKKIIDNQKERLGHQRSLHYPGGYVLGVVTGN